MNPSKVAAIIPAAGSGIRMGLSVPKQCYELGDKPILAHTLLKIEQSDSIGSIVLVVPADHKFWAEQLLQKYQLAKVTKVISGGKERRDSVLAGLNVLPDKVELVLVHDGVRPFVPVAVIENCLQEAEQSGAAMAAIPVKDTLKSVSSGKVVEKTISRDGVWQAQTPQAVSKSLLKQAYALAAQMNNFTATDEAGLLELLGHPVKVVQGSEQNIKITRPEDLLLAKAILKERGVDMKSIDEVCRYHSGYGYDAHRLVPGRPLILGGQEIPFTKGLQGHSDGDVLTHALCDAMLGAAGAGDIGLHFPDTDQKIKNINSLKILKSVVYLITDKGYVFANADITLVAQQPKLAPYSEAMQKNLAQACGVHTGSINLKATTTEGMGFEGRGEGMSAHAVVMLKKL